MLAVFDNEVDFTDTSEKDHATQVDFTAGVKLSSTIAANPVGSDLAKTKVALKAESPFPHWHDDVSIEHPSHHDDDWWHKHPIVQSLLKGHGDSEYIPKRVRQIQSHFNTSYKIDMPHGQEGVFKSLAHERDGGTRPNNIKSPSFRREALAWEMAHTLGMGDLVPPTITRDMPGRGVGSYQHWVNGIAAPDFHKSNQTTPFDGPKDHARAAAFDYLTGNLDRHLGNWLITPKGKLALIDNGSTFPETAKTEHSLPHLPVLSGESDILRRASHPLGPHLPNSGLPVPKEAAKWGKHEEALLRATQRHKLTENETEQFRERLHHLSRAAKNGRSFTDLIENSPFAYADLKGGTLVPGQDLDMLHRRLAG